MSAELWLAEGFTQYYGPIALSRAGLADLGATTDTLTWLIQYVARPGRAIRSAEEMSRMAPFTDGGKTVDRTNWPDTYISYYPFGGAIALGLDLSLRERSDNHVSLDDFMRALWRAYGKPGGSREGYVDHPYTVADVQQRLAEISDEAFAREFFARFIHGHDAPDFATLLKPAGFVMRKTNPGRAWWGDVALEQRSGVRLSAAPLSDTPAYKAGLDLGDQITGIDGARITSIDQVRTLLRDRAPGDSVSVEFVDRTGSTRTSRLTLVEDPHIEVVPVESTGESLTAAVRAFRRAWLLPQ
jgi:predicted metalloprotease with PDZ domain